MSRDIRAGGAYVELATRSAAFERGLAAAQARLGAFSAGVMKAGAVITAAGTAFYAPFLYAAKVYTQVGSELVDLSDRTSIAVETLDALGYAAEQNDASLADIGTAIKIMSKNLEAAAHAADDASAKMADVDIQIDGESVGTLRGVSRALHELGIDVASLAGLKPDEKFLRLADAISRVVDPTKQLALAQQVFGRGAMTLIPLMKAGAGGIRELMREAERLGIVMSEEDARAAEAFGDAVARVQRQIRQLVVAVGSGLEPVLSRMVAITQEYLVPAIAWAKANGRLVATVAQLAAGLAAVGAAVTAVGVFLFGLSQIAGVGALAFGTLTALLGIWLNRWFVVARWIASAGYAFVQWSSAGRQAIGGFTQWLAARMASVVGWLRDVWASFIDDFTRGWNAAARAFGAGQMVAAFRVVGALFRVEWARVTQFMTDGWRQAQSFIMKMTAGTVETFFNYWTTSSAAVGQLLSGLWTGMRIGFIRSLPYMQGAWQTFLSALYMGWKTLIGSVAIGLALAAEKAGLIPKGSAKGVAQDTVRDVEERWKKGQDETKKWQEAADKDAAALAKDEMAKQADIERQAQLEREKAAREFQQKMDAINAADEQGAQERAQAVAEAMKEYQDAIDAANLAAENASKDLKNPIADPEALNKAAAGAGGGAGGDTKSRGSFLAAAVQSLQVGDNDTIRQQLATQKKMERHLAKLADGGRVQFA